MKNLTKIPSPALLARLRKESLRACGARRQSGDANARDGFHRKVFDDYQARLERNGIYVEHAGRPECNTEEWRQRDRADELREVSWMAITKRIA